MQSGKTLVSSQLHIPGVFSGSSSSRELCPVKGILSDRKKPPRSNKRVSFDENSLRKRKRTISLTSLKWQAYIEEQFRTLRAHRKRKSKRENGRNVFQKKPQPVPRSKNRSKKQESNGSAHLSDVNMFELPKTDGRRPEDPERYYMQNENSYTTNQREQAMTYEGGEHVGSVKVVKPKRPLNAFFVFAQYCRKKHLLDSMRSSNHACRAMGRVWRHMSMDERSVFYEHADRLRAEYFRQKGEWEKRTAQSPVARKRPLNGYTLFCREHFSLVRYKMSHPHPCLVIVRLARMWRRLHRSVKLDYKRKAKATTRHFVPDLIPILPIYPRVVADVPSDKPLDVHFEVRSEVAIDEPEDVASRDSSREPVEYSDYRYVDPPIDISTTIEPPVDISKTIEPPVDISKIIQPPLETFSPIEPPVDSSIAIKTPINISSTIESPIEISSPINPHDDLAKHTPCEFSSTIPHGGISSTIDHHDDLSSTIERPVDISSTMDPPVDSPSIINTHGKVSSTIAPPVDIPSTIDTHGKISSTIAPSVDIPSTINTHGKISSTIAPPVDIPSTIDTHGKISSTIAPSVDIPSTINTHGKISSTIAPPVDIPSTIDTHGKISSTIAPSVDIPSTINTHGKVSSTIAPPVDIPSTIDTHGKVSSTIAPPVDIPSTIDTHGKVSSTIAPPVDIPRTIDTHGKVSSTIAYHVDIPSSVDPPGETSLSVDPRDYPLSTICLPADISESIEGIVDVSKTVEPGVVPSMSGENKKLQEVYETSGMEKGIENEENAILSSTPMSDEEKPSVSDEQDGNNSETSGDQFLGTNCNNTCSDASDCDGQPSHNSHIKMDITIDDDDDALSQGSRTSAITPSTYAASSVLTLTSVSHDSVVSAGTLLSSCTIHSDQVPVPVLTATERPPLCCCEQPPQSSSQPLPTCSTHQDHTTRRNRILKSRTKRLQRKQRHVKKINMEMSDRTAGNIDFHLSTVSEKSSADDSSRAKSKRSMHDYLSLMSDDELPIKIMSDIKLKKYLLELKALKSKYKPSYKTSSLRSNSVMDAMSELDLYFATVEASIDSEDSLISVLSSDSDDTLFAMQCKAKSPPCDKDSPFEDDLTSNSSDSLSFCFISSHLLASPAASTTVQQVFQARAEAALELGTMNMSAAIVNNESSPSYHLNASVKNDKTTVQMFGDKSLNHAQKASLLHGPVKDKKAPSAHCAYLCSPCQPAAPPKHPCSQLAVCQTAPWSVIQDELRFSSSEAEVPRKRCLTGRVQDREVMTCRQPNPYKQRLRSCQTERPHCSSANERRRRDERRKCLSERLSPTNEFFWASCPLNDKKKPLFSPLSCPQQASIVPVAEKFACVSTHAAERVKPCRKVSVSSGSQHGEGEADQCESWKKSFDQDILRLSAKLQMVSLSEQGDSSSDLDTMKSIGSSPSLKRSGAVTEEESASLESTSGSATGVTFACSQRDSRSLRRAIRFRTVAERSEIRSRSARSHGCSADRRPFGDDDRDICSMVMDDEEVLETPACLPLGNKKKLGWDKHDVLDGVKSFRDGRTIKAIKDRHQSRCQNPNIWGLATSSDKSAGVHKYREEM